MQKKLIALAVAGLMSAPVFAQSNVTIYGIVDMGYKFLGNHYESGVGSRQAVDSGISAGNRLGFKGTEDLGNGLKASFVLETGFYGDRAGYTGGGFGHRQSYLALSGGFGTVALGRQYTPQHVFTGAVDPFGKGNLGNAGNVLIQDARLDNLAAYVSPTFGGFSVIAAFTNSAAGDESVDNGSGLGGAGDARVWALAPSYKNGPLFVALNFHQIRTNATTVGGSSETKVSDVYGSYDFGVVKLGASYGIRDIDAVAAASDVKHKQWLVGVTVPVGASGKVLAAFNQRKSEVAGSDGRVNKWTVGYEHSLSKRTALYANYAQINQNSTAEDTTSLRADLADATGGNGYGYQRGLAVGVRHSF